METMGQPKIAVVGSNTLALIGMRQLLQSVMPIVEVVTLGSFAELTANHPDQYFHYFVSMESDFHCLYINQPEQQLLHALLQLEQHAHRGGRNLPPTATESAQPRQLLTRREVEVMSLIVQGYINKEVADKLHIGLSTVITHRKNIMDKLGLKSVSALTIYAVTHGYVDVDKVKG